MSTDGLQASADIGRGQLMQLTGAKAVINTALRWLPFFLPTLAGAFSTTTVRLTTILGVGETAGLSTLLIGRQLDGGRERRIMVGALGLAAVSYAGALVGNLWIFAVSFIIKINKNEICMSRIICGGSETLVNLIRIQCPVHQ